MLPFTQGITSPIYKKAEPLAFNIWDTLKIFLGNLIWFVLYVKYISVCRLAITSKLVSNMTCHCLETLACATLDSQEDNISSSAYVKIHITITNNTEFV